MKNTHNLNMDCREAMDVLYESSGFSRISTEEKGISLYRTLRTKAHIFFCQRCAEEQRQIEMCTEMLRTDFFPSASLSIEDKVMAELSAENPENEIFSEAIGEVPGGFSFKSWVIIGLFILISMTVSFLGTEFISLAKDLGTSFLISLGLTIGIMLTGYGAFFIGSHLKELSTHFKLH